METGKEQSRLYHWINRGTLMGPVVGRTVEMALCAIGRTARERVLVAIFLIEV